MLIALSADHLGQPVPVDGDRVVPIKVLLPIQPILHLALVLRGSTGTIRQLEVRGIVSLIRLLTPLIQLPVILLTPLVR